MKLVIADLDGTLVHKQFVSKETLKTIKKLKEQGVLFTIATGRHMVATKELAEKLEVDLPVICGNGAIIYDFKNDEIMHQEILSDEILNTIIERCFEDNLDFLMYTTKYVVATKQAANKIHQKIGMFDTHIVKKEQLKDYIKIGVFKILVIDEHVDKLKTLKQYLSKSKEISMVQSQPFFLDIGHHLSNKGRTITKLADLLNVDMKDVLAIGDQENDITMIETAGLGIAMGNGHLELKRVADDITDTFSNEGFTQAIKKHILKKHEKS
jgi:Cof subfamily protein (haloacid dehalogenase superfamily)